MDRMEDYQLNIVYVNCMIEGNLTKAEQAKAILDARKEQNQQGGDK